MAQAAATTAFQPPEIPWHTPQQPLTAELELGSGLEPVPLRDALGRLCADSSVQAVLAFGSRARGKARPDSDLDLAVICAETSLEPVLKTERWLHYRNLIGQLGCGVDLVVQGSADAERLAGSRWHVMGDAAREGRVLYVAG
jgi:predicted nucleotidyltransferase